MPKVLIYRHQLFLPSEPFITQQAQALQRYTPIYVGRSMRTGAIPPTTTVTLADTGRLGLVRHAVFKDVSVLAQRCSQYQPTLVHAHFGVEGVYALPLAKRLGVQGVMDSLRPGPAAPC
jgi:hypothetical protein